MSRKCVLLKDLVPSVSLQRVKGRVPHRAKAFDAEFAKFNAEFRGVRPMY